MFSNLVKLDNFQRNLPFKVRLWKLIPTKQVFEIHLRKLIKNWHLNSNLWSAFSIWKVKKDDPMKLNEKSTFKIFGKLLSWLLDLLLKLLSLTGVLLQVATSVCIKTWLYSPLMSTSFLAHLFVIFLKLFWGRGCFIAETSTTLNLA